MRPLSLSWSLYSITRSGASCDSWWISIDSVYNICCICMSLCLFVYICLTLNVYMSHLECLSVYIICLYVHIYLYISTLSIYLWPTVNKHFFKLTFLHLLTYFRIKKTFCFKTGNILLSIDPLMLGRLKTFKNQQLQTISLVFNNLLPD